MAGLPSSIRLLFWDVDWTTFNATAYPTYAIERVLERGDEHAHHWMRQTFSDDVIRSVLRNSRRLSPRSATFWALVFNVPRSEVTALLDCANAR